jgi:hypothetical protein
LTAVEVLRRNAGSLVSAINGAIGGFFIGWLGEHSFGRLTRVVVFVGVVSLILGAWLIELRSDDYTGMITVIAAAIGLAWPLLSRTLLR